MEFLAERIELLYIAGQRRFGADFAEDGDGCGARVWTDVELAAWLLHYRGDVAGAWSEFHDAQREFLA